jgi:hypothetical protein
MVDRGTSNRSMSLHERFRTPEYEEEMRARISKFLTDLETAFDARDPLPLLLMSAY